VSPFQVPEEVYQRLADYFLPAQLVALTAFGALMVATNVFNNALDVDLDEYLQPYRKGVREAASASRPA
jgi:4-hydroxybenzoate polyprenyltransferase